MPQTRVDWQTYEIRRIANEEMRLCFAWTIIEYLDGVYADNLPEDIKREAKLLAASTSGSRLKEVIRNIRGIRDYDTLKTRFGIDHSAIEEYVDQGDVSALEGWQFARRDDDGRFVIRRYEGDPQHHFATDADASSYVLWRAARGSEFHREIAGVLGLGNDQACDIVS